MQKRIVLDYPSSETPVTVIRVNGHPDYPAHAHRFWEIVFVVGGNAWHQVGSASFRIRSGDAFVINDREKHSYSDVHDLKLVNVLFDYKRLAVHNWPVAKMRGFRELFHRRPDPGEAALLLSRLNVGVEHFGNWLALVSEIELCQAEKLPCWESLVEIHFHHLILLMARASEGALRSHNEASDRLLKVINRIEEHHTEVVDIDDLAKSAGMSSRTFRRLFRKATGASPLAYLIRTRVERACILLRDTDKPISQIAFDSGYSDSNYFSREFRKIKGESPTDYRRRWAN